jgi:hypothetical protein
MLLVSGYIFNRPLYYFFQVVLADCTILLVADPAREFQATVSVDEKFN